MAKFDRDAEVSITSKAYKFHEEFPWRIQTLSKPNRQYILVLLEISEFIQKELGAVCG